MRLFRLLATGLLVYAGYQFISGLYGGDDGGGGDQGNGQPQGGGGGMTEGEDAEFGRGDTGTALAMAPTGQADNRDEFGQAFQRPADAAGIITDQDDRGMLTETADAAGTSAHHRVGRGVVH